MYEYVLDHHEQTDSFVLCRVLLRSCGGNKRVEHVPDSYSVGALHNDGISTAAKQRDGASVSGVGEVVINEDTFIDTENEIQRFWKRVISKPDNPIVAGAVSDGDLLLAMGISQPSDLVRTSNEIISGRVIFDDAEADKLIINSILGEDFLELDDLVYSLPDNDLPG